MLIQFIRRLVSGGPLYVRVRSNLLSVRDVRAKKSIEDIPLVAVSKGGKRIILAIGKDAMREATQSRVEYDLINGFEHPRSIISNFTIAEKTLQHFIRELSDFKYFSPSPVVVMHALEKTEGGLTEVEVRALQELAAGAGAREVYVWTGRELSDHEFETRRFPGDCWLPVRPKWAKIQ